MHYTYQNLVASWWLVQQLSAQKAVSMLSGKNDYSTPAGNWLICYCIMIKPYYVLQNPYTPRSFFTVKGH